MTDIIMVGCNGRMGQMITGLVNEDADCRIVAGIDIVDNRDNGYPVFTDIDTCDIKADVIIDFSLQTDLRSAWIMQQRQEHRSCSARPV